jgi:hypothetical protein
MAPPRRENDTPSADPLAVLREAIKRVPAVRFAFGVLGVAAAASLMRAYFSSFRTAVYATLAVLVLMVLLWLFAQLARLPMTWLKYPAMLVAWSLFSVAACTPVFLFSSVFFNKPRPFAELRSLFDSKPSTDSDQAATPASAAKTNEPARFAGTITDYVTGLGLEGVSVHLKPHGPVMAKTNSEGFYVFSLPALPPERVTLIYEAAGHATLTESVYPSGKLDFQLHPLP